MKIGDKLHIAPKSGGIRVGTIVDINTYQNKVLIRYTLNNKTREHWFNIDDTVTNS